MALKSKRKVGKPCSADTRAVSGAQTHLLFIHWNCIGLVSGSSCPSFPVAEALGGVPVLRPEGTAFPVGPAEPLHALGTWAPGVDSLRSRGSSAVSQPCPKPASTGDLDLARPPADLVSRFSPP